MSGGVVVVVDPRFPRLLVELRRERGLSLRGLARLVNYSHTYLWEIETGRKPPTMHFAGSVDATLQAGGRLAELVEEKPAPVVSAPTLPAGDLVVDRARLEALAAAAWSSSATPDDLLAAARLAQVASWLYELFVRRRPRLMRLVPRRYSRSSREETGLTPFRLEATAQGRVPHTECRSVTVAPAPAVIAERLGLSANTPVVGRENLYYADGEPVQLGVTYMAVELAERAALAAVTAPQAGGIYSRLADAGHLYNHSREEIGARLPTRYETTALSIPVGVPVLDVLHTSYSISGAPIEVTCFVLRADLASIHCEVPVGE